MTQGFVLFAWITRILIALQREAGADEVLPLSLGCFRTESNVHTMPNCKLEDPVNMNQNLCIDHCSANEQTFAGIQNGSVCWCSEKYPKAGKAPDSYCRTPCAGNLAEYCGGQRGLTVFSVCDEGHYGPKCDLPCMCDDNFVCDFMTGRCLNGKCQSGWQGERCDATQRSGLGEKIHQFVTYAKELGNRIKSWIVISDDPPETCDNGRYGVWCKTVCNCLSETPCERLTGVCVGNKCAFGWLGKRCDKPNPCGSNPCENNGTCALDGFSMHCVCAYPYSGSNCEIVDPCSRSPCFNGGSCVSNGSIFRCDCQGDYGGDLCELDLKSLPQSHVYLGCFREVENEREFVKQLSELDANAMTPQRCAMRCKAKRYTYAALQVGNQCWCSNSYARYGAITEASCSSPCTGDKSAKCGARSANSVYSVCSIGSYKADCKGVCNCFAAQCDAATGGCPTSFCQIGYQGPRCDQTNAETTEKYSKSRQYMAYAVGAFAAFAVAQIACCAAKTYSSAKPKKSNEAKTKKAKTDAEDQTKEPDVFLSVPTKMSSKKKSILSKGSKKSTLKYDVKYAQKSASK